MEAAAEPRATKTVKARAHGCGYTHGAHTRDCIGHQLTRALYAPVHLSLHTGGLLRSCTRGRCVRSHTLKQSHCARRSLLDAALRPAHSRSSRGQSLPRRQRQLAAFCRHAHEHLPCAVDDAAAVRARDQWGVRARCGADCRRRRDCGAATNERRMTTTRDAMLLSSCQLLVVCVCLLALYLLGNSCVLYAAARSSACIQQLRHSLTSHV